MAYRKLVSNHSLEQARPTLLAAYKVLREKQ